MNQYEAQTDGQTCEVVGSAIGLGSGTQHHEHEDTGEDNLGQQTAQHGDVSLQVVSTRTLQTGYVGCQDIKQQRADEGTDTLEQDVHTTVLTAHTTS